MKRLIFAFGLGLLICGLTSQGSAQVNEKYSKFVHEVLPNGLDLIISYNPDSRVFAINILGKDRAANEPAGKDGITDFVNRMITLGADGMNAEEIQNKLDDIGAMITSNDNPYIPYDDRYTTRAFSIRAGLDASTVTPGSAAATASAEAGRSGASGRRQRMMARSICGLNSRTRCEGGTISSCSRLWMISARFLPSSARCKRSTT